MTAIDNLTSILNNGLLSHNEAYKLREITDISDQTVQGLRSKKSIDGKGLHDYVCLYFSPKNPMLYVRKEFQENIVILGIDPSLLLDRSTIFSDGNAAASNTNFYRGTARLDQLPWEIINSRYWNDFEDGKRIKCAEVLVFPKIKTTSILKVFCYSDNQVSIISRLIPPDANINVEVNRNLYF